MNRNLKSWVILVFCATFPLFVQPGVAGAETADEKTELSPSDLRALRELEQRVTTLKEEVHQSKLKMQELEEAVLRGKITGSKLFVSFENRAQGYFAFSDAEFYLDNELIMKIEPSKDGKPQQTFKILDRDIPSGTHDLKARIQFTGSDQSIYQMFSYFKDHKFQVSTTEAIPVEYGKTTHVKIVALDKGYFKEKPEERLYLQVQISKDWGSEPPE